MNSVTKFITNDSAPEFGYKQSLITGIGNVILFPAQQLIELWTVADIKETVSSKIVYKIASVFFNLILAPITLLGMIVKGIGLALPQHKYASSELTDQTLNIHRLSPEESSEIYNTLDQFNKLAQEIGLPYILDAGTLLGAERHGGVIPWDDDADLIILEKDEKTLIEAEKTFAKYGLFLEKQPLEGAYKVGFIGRKPFMDIFVLKWMPATEQSPAKLHFTSPYFQALFTRHYYTAEDFGQETPQKPDDWSFPTENIPFGPPHPVTKERMLLPVPKHDRLAHLKRTYGENCMEEGIHSHFHTMIFGLVVALPNLQKCRFKITDMTLASWTIGLSPAE